MKKVLVCRIMVRYDHMDECGIGTECSDILDKITLFSVPVSMPALTEQVLKAMAIIQSRMAYSICVPALDQTMTFFTPGPFTAIAEKIFLQPSHQSITFLSKPKNRFERF